MAVTNVRGEQIKDASLSLTADVTGVLPIANGGTNTASLPTGILKGAGTGAITAAAADTDYLTPATDASVNKWMARNPGPSSVPPMRVSYYDKANTAWASLPTTLDTGQAITYSAGTTADQLLINNGGLSIANTAAGASAAGYVNLDAGSANLLTRIGVKFKLETGVGSTTGATVALAMSNGAFLGSGGTAYRMVHLTCDEDTWDLSVVTNATGSLVFTSIGSGTLENTLESGAGYEYTLEMWRVSNTITIILPDGQRVTATNANVGTYAGRYGYYENFLLTRATDKLPSITEAWADIGTQYPPGGAGLVTRDDLTAAGSGLGVVHTSGNESIAGVKTFTSTPAVNNITVNSPNPGSASTSMFLVQTGQQWEFFCNTGGQFGVWDGTNAKQPFTVVPNAPTDSFKVNSSGYLTNLTGQIDAEQFITLTSAYTLANQTAAQKLFNSPTNGAVTLLANTTYFFECCFALSALSASSHSVGFAFAGTAVRTREAWWAEAVLAAPGTASTAQRTFNTAAQTTLVTAGTATTFSAFIKGKVVIGTAGTLIPQVSQLTNAAAAIVGVDSFFRIWAVGANTVQSVGSWA